MVASTPSKSVKKPKSVASHPKTLDMIVEAIKALKDRKGTSVVSIKSHILSHYSTVSATHLTSSLRRAIKSGLESGLLVRPKDSGANGVSGRLRLGKLPEKPKKKTLAKKKTTEKKTTPKKAAKKVKTSKDKKETKKPKSEKKSQANKSDIKKTTKKKAEKAVAKKTATKKSPKKASKSKKPSTKKTAKK